MRRTGIALCLVLLTTSCGGGRETETSSGASIRWIDVDARTNRFTGSFLSFFPNQVTVRAGDTVAFRSLYNGEPHNVTFGTLVNRALEKSTPAADRPKLPTWTLGEGPTFPANIGRPCYLKKGGPPAEPTRSCDVSEPGVFDGKQTYFSSGFLSDEKVFRVRFDKGMEPSTHRFFCSFHPEMQGKIRVVGSDDEIPSQDEVDEAAKAKLTEFVDGTLPTHAKTYEPYDDSRTGDFPWPALASFDTFRGRVRVNEFVPFTLKAKVNEEVSWSILRAHTIAFDAPDNARPPSIRILNTGETELKADAVNENRSAEPPSGAPKKKVVVTAGRYSDGFLSSGMLYSPKRGLITYTVRFKDPGSYRYQCLLHPRMSGLVTVAS